MNVVYSPRALRDLRAISKYLIQKNPHAERRVLAAIRSSLETLEFFPEMGNFIKSSGRYRLFIKRYPYHAFYRIHDDKAVILHIRHTSRAPVNPSLDL